jgi:CheY-like chemotaxis protein
VAKVVLVVEDDPCIRMLAESLLSTLPEVKVIAVKDGVEALDVVAQSTPDLMVLDLMLPRMDGFQVLSHLRALPATRSLPVIVMSAMRQALGRAQEVGSQGCHDCLDFVEKPFELEDLLGKVDARLALKRSPGMA